MHIFLSIIRWIGIACLATLLISTPGRADIELPSAPPPQPARISIQVFRGESVEIPLSGVTRSGAGLQFHIKRQPRSGTLSDLRMTGLNTATITYTPNANTVGVDRFRYAVSAPGIGVSAPADVIVNVIERPSIFFSPARLDFEDTPIGKPTHRTFEIRNDGGGTIEGRLVVSKPWEIVNESRYTLGPGDSQTLTISFAPTSAERYSAIAQFTHAPGFELGLSGRGYNPIEIVPREIRLVPYGPDEARRGSCVLRNISNEDQEVTIGVPPEVITEGKFFIQAHSEIQMTFYTRAGFLGELDGLLTATCGGMSIQTPLHVSAAPARIVVEPAILDFGTIELGHSASKKMIVRNVGGSPANLKINLPSNIQMTPDPTFEKIFPATSREIGVSFSSPRNGRFSLEFVIEAGESKVQIPVTAIVKSTSHSASTTSLQPATQKITYSDIPSVMQIGVTRQTRTELDIVWKKTSPKVARYELFMRNIVFDEKGRPQFKFQRLDRVKVRFIRNEARVTLAGLRAGESVALCIIGFDSAGLASPPSPIFTLATKPKPVFHFPWLWLVALVAIVLSVLIARERRKARIVSDAEVSRIEPS